MNIFVTRHGETEWNTHWKLQGRSNTVLNEKGKEQATRTRIGFEKAGLSFDRVYSSPLKRAVETAMLMTGKSENEIIKDDRIIEFCFGKAEGKTPAERDADPELKNFHNFFDDPENFIPLEGCESFDSVLARTASFWEDEIKSLENSGIQNVLVVTHGGTMQSLLLHIDGRELKDYWKSKMANCTLNKIVLENGKFSLEYTGKVFYQEDKNSAEGFFSK